MFIYIDQFNLFLNNLLSKYTIFWQTFNGRFGAGIFSYLVTREYNRLYYKLTVYEYVLLDHL